MFENITLSQDEMSVILGGLLGDAHFRVDHNHNTIAFRHSLKQKEYLLFKYNLLIDIARNVRESKDLLGYEYIIFNTKSNPYLLNNLYKPLEKLVYDEGRKTVTRKWLNMLTPLSLAIWWMDDGNLSVHRGNRYGKLSTHSFSYDEHMIIKKYFKTVWDIDVQIKIEKKKYFFIRFNVENLRKLITVIYPYVLKIPSMIYKIDLNYKNNVNLGNFESIYWQIKNAHACAIN